MHTMNTSTSTTAITINGINVPKDIFLHVIIPFYQSNDVSDLFILTAINKDFYSILYRYFNHYDQYPSKRLDFLHLLNSVETEKRVKESFEGHSVDDVTSEVRMLESLYKMIQKERNFYNLAIASAAWIKICPHNMDEQLESLATECEKIADTYLKASKREKLNPTACQKFKKNASEHKNKALKYKKIAAIHRQIKRVQPLYLGKLRFVDTKSIIQNSLTSFLWSEENSRYKRSFDNLTKFHKGSLSDFNDKLWWEVKFFGFDNTLKKYEEYEYEQDTTDEFYTIFSHIITLNIAKMDYKTFEKMIVKSLKQDLEKVASYFELFFENTGILHADFLALKTFFNPNDEQNRHNFMMTHTISALLGEKNCFFLGALMDTEHYKALGRKFANDFSVLKIMLKIVINRVNEFSLDEAFKLTSIFFVYLCLSEYTKICDHETEQKLQRAILKLGEIIHLRCFSDKTINSLLENIKYIAWTKESQASLSHYQKYMKSNLYNSLKVQSTGIASYIKKEEIETIVKKFGLLKANIKEYTDLEVEEKLKLLIARVNRVAINHNLSTTENKKLRESLELFLPYKKECRNSYVNIFLKGCEISLLLSLRNATLTEKNIVAKLWCHAVNRVVSENIVQSEKNGKIKLQIDTEKKNTRKRVKQLITPFTINDAPTRIKKFITALREYVNNFNYSTTIPREIQDNSYEDHCKNFIHGRYVLTHTIFEATLVLITSTEMSLKDKKNIRAIIMPWIQQVKSNQTLRSDTNIVNALQSAENVIYKLFTAPGPMLTLASTKNKDNFNPSDNPLKPLYRDLLLRASLLPEDNVKKIVQVILSAVDTDQNSPLLASTNKKIRKEQALDKDEEDEIAIEEQTNNRTQIQEKALQLCSSLILLNNSKGDLKPQQILKKIASFYYKELSKIPSPKNKENFFNSRHSLEWKSKQNGLLNMKKTIAKIVCKLTKEIAILSKLKSQSYIPNTSGFGKK